MKDTRDEDWLDGIIHQAVDIGNVKFDRKRWLDRLAVPPKEPTEPGRQTYNKKPGQHRSIWRTIMESKVTRYSVAATVLVAASLILTNPFGFLGGSQGIALAEVVEKMNAVETIVHKEKRVYYEVGKDEPLLRADVIKYVSSRQGIVEEQYDEKGNLQYRVYIQKEPQQLIFVFVRERQYLKLPMGESWARLMDRLTPRGLVEYFKSGNYQELGPGRFEGRDVEGFAVSDAGLFPLADQYRFLFPVEGIQWRFWIDTETLLPAGADLEVTTGRGLFTAFKKLRITCHDYDMKYDQEIPATMFDPNIPEDYTPLNLESVAEKNAAWIGVGALPIVGIVAHRRHRRIQLRKGPIAK